MENSCKNCKFWDKREHDRVLHLGRCTRAQMIWDVTEWDEDLYETSEYSRVFKTKSLKMKNILVNDGSDFKAVLTNKRKF